VACYSVHWTSIAFFRFLFASWGGANSVQPHDRAINRLAFVVVKFGEIIMPNEDAFRQSSYSVHIIRYLGLSITWLIGRSKVGSSLSTDLRRRTLLMNFNEWLALSHGSSCDVHRQRDTGHCQYIALDNGWQRLSCWRCSMEQPSTAGDVITVVDNLSATFENWTDGSD